MWKYGSSLVDVLDPQEGETILDLGCGTGELAHEIFKRGASNVIGIDADPQMIQQAVKQFATADEKKIDFRVADARSFTVGEQVDAIFSNAALHWVPEADKCVACMAAALKPDTGRLVIELGGKGNIQEIVNYLDRATTTTTTSPDGEKKKKKNPWYFPSIAEYTSLLEQHGIEVLNAQLFDRPTDLLEGENGLRNWILMFGGPYLEGLKDDEVESLLDEAQVELRPKLFNGEYWTADYRRLRIVGRKVGASAKTGK